MFEKISQFDLESFDLSYLKKLYMLQPRVSLFKKNATYKITLIFIKNTSRIHHVCYIGYKKSRAVTLTARVIQTTWRTYSRISTNYPHWLSVSVSKATKSTRLTCLMMSFSSGHYSYTVDKKPICD